MNLKDFDKNMPSPKIKKGSILIDANSNLYIVHSRTFKTVSIAPYEITKPEPIITQDMHSNIYLEWKVTQQIQTTEYTINEINMFFRLAPKKSIKMRKALYG